MANEKIRLQLRGNAVPLWMVADRMGVSEPTITRMFRHELTAEQAAKVREIIRDIQAKRREELADDTDPATHPTRT